jgi:hypothetical protein
MKVSEQLKGLLGGVVLREEDQSSGAKKKKSRRMRIQYLEVIELLLELHACEVIRVRGCKSRKQFPLVRLII